MRIRRRLKKRSRVLIGMVGAKVAVDSNSLLQEAIDFVAARNSTHVQGNGRRKPFAQMGAQLPTLTVGQAQPGGPMIENMDELQFVAPVYKRDLKIENYFLGYLNHPYVSFYTGRGCRSRCTFCLWPQTVGGHRYRTRRRKTCEEVKWIRENMPEVKEIMFDDDTLPI